MTSPPIPPQSSASQTPVPPNPTSPTANASGPESAHAARDAAERKDVRPYTFRGEGTGFPQPLWWGFGRFISRIISVLWFRFTVAGRENIPAEGPVLMVTNHQSFLDPWLVGIAPRRQIHYMARDTLFKGGVFHGVIERLNAFPIKRGAADRQALSMAVERLDRGFIVNIFPEGTRSEDGTIGPVAPGMAIILNRCKKDVPILPVLIDGAYAAWPRNKKFPSAHPIHLVHGKAILASEWRKMSADDLAWRVRAELVKLQEQIGSPYAKASRARLEAERAEAAAKPVRGRRGR